MINNIQQFVSQMMNRATTPMQKNALEMISNKDEAGLEQLARNICKERNIDVEAMVNRVKGMR